MKNPVSGPFHSLRRFNFRLWTAGGLISNVGTWMHRVTQDWLVLTRLTHHDASALGIVMGLQFAPQLVLLPWTGSAADRLNQHKLLMLTHASMSVLALILGALTIAGVIRLWHVYIFAFLSGSAAALDAPVRQAFVAEMVGDADLPNAVALNSTSFNAAQMIGPAVAGLLEPTAMMEESRPKARASEWKTFTAIVEMKIGKFSPKVPIINNMTRIALRSGLLHT
jgi:MFS family permease